jgi:hypothetical protein
VLLLQVDKKKVEKKRALPVMTPFINRHDSPGIIPLGQESMVMAYGLGENKRVAQEAFYFPPIKHIKLEPHHLMHYKKEAIVLIIRKILTELRPMTPSF